MKLEKKQKSIIGRLEYVSLLDFGLNNIIAKIDTGAYNCAAHANNIVIENNKLSFYLLDGHDKTSDSKFIETKDFKIRYVKNSKGVSEKRFFIKTKILLKDLELTVDLSLVDRGSMRYPILIGRKFFKKHFIVDAAKKFTK